MFNYVGALEILLLVISALYIRDPGQIPTMAGQSFKTFLGDVFGSLFHTARSPHIWMAAGFGALCFGVMLGLGVVWAPKLMVRGLEASVANFASSFLWLGLAAGCFAAPWLSDRLQRRKLPILIAEYPGEWMRRFRWISGPRCAWHCNGRRAGPYPPRTIREAR